jgi:hypothetical protein
MFTAQANAFNHNNYNQQKVIQEGQGAQQGISITSLEVSDIIVSDFECSLLKENSRKQSILCRT